MNKSRAMLDCPLICVALAVAVIVIYWPVHNFDFTNYDDDNYVYDNPPVLGGLSVAGVKWAFTTGHVANWHPLTWISHMIDVQAFGPEPGGPHVVNVGFHLANVLVLFLILRAMTGATWTSAFVAALFAVHPSHVESVAWISERKDVLSTFFWMLTLGAYVFYARRPGVLRYIPVAMLFVLALLAKPMVVTLPAVLLLLDFWPLGRVGFRVSGFGSREDIEVKGKGTRRKTSVSPESPSSSLSLSSSPKPETRYPIPDIQWDRMPRLILEKIPLLILAIALSVVTLYVQQAARFPLPLGVRLENAVVAYMRYIQMTVLPKDLAVLYPHPGANLPKSQVLAAVLALTAISAGAVRACRHRPYLIVGWLWFLGTLVPVIGIVQVGIQAFADRYSYIPSIGLYIIGAWGARDLAARFPATRVFRIAAACIVIAALMICARHQVGYWKDSLTLFKHTLDVTTDNYQAHCNYGDALARGGHPEEALPHYEATLRIQPAHRNALVNMGNTLAMLKRPANAAVCYEKALPLDPKAPDIYINLGNANAEQNRLDEAVGYYRKALELDASKGDTYTGLAYALLRQGKVREAVDTLTQCLKVAPNNAAARNMLDQINNELNRANPRR